MNTNYYFNQNGELISCTPECADESYFYEGACPENITYELIASNGYDSIKANVTLDFGNGGFHHNTVITGILNDMKSIVQNVGNEYITKNQVETSVNKTTEKIGNASPKQRQILLRNGYTESQIDAMGQKEASEAVKAIFESKN